MVKPNYTHLEVILDRSGSMEIVRKDTVGGFNAFLAEQQKAEYGTGTISLVQFDDKYEPNYEFKPLPEAPLLTEETYVPRGWTALHDAMARSIIALGKRLAAMPEALRPGKVIVLVVTDGQENRSVEWSQQAVAAMVKEQREKYGWDFVFLGANQDAVLTASHLNIPTNSAATWNATSRGTRSAYVNTSGAIGSARISGQSVGYSIQQRKDIEETK